MLIKYSRRLLPDNFLLKLNYTKMKNLLLLFVFLVSLIFYSCQNDKNLLESTFDRKMSVEERNKIRTEIAAKFPDSKYGLFCKGYAAMIKDNFDSAGVFFDKAISKIEQSDSKSFISELYGSKGAMSLKLMKFDDAVKEFTKAIDTDPSKSNNFVGRAYGYAGANNMDKACADLKKGVDLGDPTAKQLYEEKCVSANK